VPRRSPRKEAIPEGRAARAAAAITQHPRETVGILMATAATAIIFVNALFLQSGPHPAPIFAPRPPAREVRTIPLPAPRSAPVKVEAPAQAAPPAAAMTRAQLIAEIQRELSRKGFYDGNADGVWGAKTDTAVREFLRAAGLKTNAEASDALLRVIAASNVHAAAQEKAPRNDPIAQLLAPSKRILAVQSALSDFGYGQIKPTGVIDADTRAAIEKFERERNLPVDGDISDQMVRELAAVTARPLD